MTPCLISYGNNAMQDFFYLNFLLHKNSPGIQTLLSISPELFLFLHDLIAPKFSYSLTNRDLPVIFFGCSLIARASCHAVPASVFLMFWYFLKVVYNRACESRGEWIKVRKLKMYKSLTFFLFNVRMTKKKRVLRPYSIITQAGCSLLFLCAKYHKDTFFHLHRAAQAFLLRKYYSESRCHFLRKQADQIVHHNDTNHF